MVFVSHTAEHQRRMKIVVVYMHYDFNIFLNLVYTILHYLFIFFENYLCGMNDELFGSGKQKPSRTNDWDAFYKGEYLIDYCCYIYEPTLFLCDCYYCCHEDFNRIVNILFAL